MAKNLASSAADNFKTVVKLGNETITATTAPVSIKQVQGGYGDNDHGTYTGRTQVLTILTVITAPSCFTSWEDPMNTV